jgi:hypothetical protein
MRTLLVAFVFTGCSAWQFPEPTARWPRPPGFGVVVWDGAPLRPMTMDSVVSLDRVFVAIHQGPGRDAELNRVEEATLELREVQPASGAVKSLPPSMLAVAPVVLWPSLEAGGVLAQQGTRVASWDGTTWTELPALPMSAKPELLRRVDARHVTLRIGGQAWVLVNGAWRMPAFVTADVVAAVWGPARDGRSRVVWQSGAQGLCTATLRLSDVMLEDTPSCLPGFIMPGGDALNGSMESFTAWTREGEELQLFHFANGSWSRGGRVRGQALLATPQSADAVVSIPVTGTFPLQDLTRAVRGRVTETLFLQSWQLFGCDGLRACARGLRSLEELVASDASTVHFVLENLVDARRSIYLKTLTVPHRDTGTCTPDCAMGQLCVRGSSIANLCVLDPAR